MNTAAIIAVATGALGVVAAAVSGWIMAWRARGDTNAQLKLTQSAERHGDTLQLQIVNDARNTSTELTARTKTIRALELRLANAPSDPITESQYAEAMDLLKAADLAGYTILRDNERMLRNPAAGGEDRNGKDSDASVDPGPSGPGVTPITVLR